MKKTSAVEWLIKIYLQTNKIDSFDIEQAKEMEKEQKKLFFECGRNFQLTGEGTFEEVYNETYNKDKQ